MATSDGYTPMAKERGIMSGYTKLFSTIVTSSIWSEDDKTRIMWITMLATADANGHVDGAVPGMAAIARMSVAEAAAAIAKLEAPDQFSRTADFDGRRIEQDEGGWRILNYAYYREKGRNMERREYFKEYKRSRRRRTGDVHQCPPVSTESHRAQPIAEAEASPYSPPKGTAVAEGNTDEMNTVELTEHDRNQIAKYPDDPNIEAKVRAERLRLTRAAGKPLG